MRSDVDQRYKLSEASIRRGLMRKPGYVSKTLASHFLRIDRPSADHLGLKIERAGEGGFYSVSAFHDLLESWSVGLSSTWISERVLKPKEAAELLGTTEGNLRTMRFRARGPKAIIICVGLYRYLYSDLINYLSERRYGQL